jgi:polysaccharide deacetylase family protein (PEP-CTERM system associated)
MVHNKNCESLDLNDPPSYILVTIDVEDWFQVENFKQYIAFSSWKNHELRVEKNTYRILDILDSATCGQPAPRNSASEPQNSECRSPNPSNSINPSNPTNPSNLKHSPKATFFVLGWIAERLPHLVREIRARGHEVASHGYHHRLYRKETRGDIKGDLIDSKRLLEDVTGVPVYGFRAPSFSINHGALKVIEDCGYVYDSSFNSFGMNKRHGQIELRRRRRKGIAFQVSHTLYELPISNLRIGTYVVPWGGGGYFRLIPLALFKIGVRSIMKKEKAYLFYMHPWEIDPEQPRVREASKLFRFRHYVNLDKTVSKLSSFIETFKECHFATCHEYLQAASS